MFLYKLWAKRLQRESVAPFHLRKHSPFLGKAFSPTTHSNRRLPLWVQVRSCLFFLQRPHNLKASILHVKEIRNHLKLNNANQSKEQQWLPVNNIWTGMFLHIEITCCECLSTEAIHQLLWVPGSSLEAQVMFFDQIFNHLVRNSFHLWNNKIRVMDCKLF